MDARKHLTGLEVDKLLAAVKGARHEARDRCLVLLLFRASLRVVQQFLIPFIDRFYLPTRLLGLRYASS